MEHTNKLLIVCGPTATGKTALAVKLAKNLNGELISADSRQVYIGMDIGTGKDISEFGNVPIHMIDVVRPDEDFSVSHYEKLGSRVISDILSRGKLPIVVGGTGFYISSLLAPPESIHVKPDSDLRKKLALKTVIQLQEQLNKLAPDVFSALNNSDKHNPRRLIRKIEIARNKGNNVYSDVKQYDSFIVGLTAPMGELTRRIEKRVEKRVKEGIIPEIQTLLSAGYSWEMASMNSLGYIQWKLYNKTPENKEAIIQTWKRDEVSYAKRQMTWFKKQKRIVWFDVSKPSYSDDVTRNILAWYTETTNENKS
jgi:tRNA dimethylallyltransferase